MLSRPSRSSEQVGCLSGPRKHGYTAGALYLPEGRIGWSFSLRRRDRSMLPPSSKAYPQVLLLPEKGLLGRGTEPAIPNEAQNVSHGGRACGLGADLALGWQSKDRMRRTHKTGKPVEPSCVLDSKDVGREVNYPPVDAVVPERLYEKGSDPLPNGLVSRVFQGLRPSVGKGSDPFSYSR